MKKLKLAIFILTVLGLDQKVKADHAFGADISYRVLDSNISKYRFTVTLYRSCSGIPNFINTNLSVRTPFFVGDIPMQLVSKQEVTPQCQPPDVAVKPATNCPGQLPMLANGTKGVERHIYTVDYTFGGTYKGWVIVGYRECCRNVEISTGQSWQNMWVQAGLNLAYVNNSTIFRSAPIPYWCRNKVNTYNHGAMDSFDSRYVTINSKQVIRDSLAFRLICPFQAEASNINDAALLKNICCTYAATLNTSNFLFTANGVTFDTKTGQYTCIPDRVQDAVMAVAVEEWRAVPNGNGGYNRVRIGYVCRDVQITVRESCPNILTPGVIEDSLVSANKISFDRVDICGRAKSKVAFKLVGAPNQELFAKVIERPRPESLINFKLVQTKVKKNSVDTIFGTVTFDSAVGVGSERLVLEVYYCDIIGNKVSTFYTLVFNFRPAVKVRDRILYYCTGGKPVRAYVSGADNYRWTPKLGILAAKPNDSSWVDLAPTTSTTFIARGIDGIDSTQSCTIVDSLRVIVIPRFNYTLAPKVSDVCLHDSIKIYLNTQLSDTPYVYKWLDPVSNGSLYNAVNNKLSTSVSSPKIIAISSRTYVVEITSKFNCILTDSVRINVNGVRPVATGMSARKLICPGDTTMLSVSVIPKTCGPSIYSCASPVVSRDVTTSIPGTFPTGTSPFYPNPLNTTGAGQGSTTRIIYTKAELTTAGIKPGIIRSIAFNMQTPNIPTIDMLEIRMGSTNTLDARILNIPMFRVYGPQSTTLTSGFPGAKFIINGGFDWDGQSNLVIETHCKSNTAMTSPNIMRTMTSVPGNQIATKLAVNVGEDAEFSNSAYVGAGPWGAKPQLQIEYCTVDSTPTATLNAQWAPSSLITNVSNPRAIGKLTQKDSVFIATVGTSQCSDTALVRLNIDQNFKVKINPGKRVFCVTGSANPTVTLTALVTGGVGTTMIWTMNNSTTGNHGMPGGSQTTNTLTVTPGVGQHTYVISAANGPCNATDTVVITVNNNIPLSLKIDPSLCAAANGKAKAILPSGSFADSFNFVWKRNSVVIAGANKDSIINLNPANYQLDIALKSDAGCTGTATGALVAVIDTLASNIFTSRIKCNGQKADSLWAVVTSSGSGNYKYNWSPSASGDTFYKLINQSAGIYNLTITDKLTGCIGRKSFNHTQPDSVKLVLESLIPVKCKGENNGEIKVKGIGGTITSGSYTFLWTGTNILNSPIPNFNHLIDMYADSLCVTLTDEENCVATACYKIVEPVKSLTIDTITKVCATTKGGTDGSATVYVSGGTANFNYKWTRQNGTPVNGAAGTTIAGTDHTAAGLNKEMFYVCVTDQNGCESCDSVMLCDVICNWKQTLVFDSVKCYDSSTAKITIGGIDSLNYATTTNYTYTLYRNSITNPAIETINRPNHYPIDTAIFKNLPTGLYIVRMESSKGCDTIISGIDIPQNALVQGIVKNEMPSCFGISDGIVDIVVSDKFRPFMYNYGSGFITDSFNLSQSAGKNKEVKIRNALGCIVNWRYDIDTPDRIMVSIDPIQTRCNGDTTKKPDTIKVSSPNPALLNNLGFMNKPGTNMDTLSNQLRGLQVGLKNIVINYTNNSNGTRCAFPYQFAVQEPEPLILSLVNASDPRCHDTKDGNISVKLASGQRGNIPDANQNYHFTLSKNNIIIDQVFTKDTQHEFSDLDSGIYTLGVTDPEFCEYRFSKTLNKPSELKVGFLSFDDANCIEVSNGSITVATPSGGNPTTGYVYQWVMKDKLDGSVKILPNATTAVATNLRGLATYEVTVWDSRNCKATKEMDLNTKYQLSLGKPKVDSVPCHGGSNGLIRIDTVFPSIAAKPFTYRFDSDDISQDQTLNYRQLAAGTYYYTVTDAVGCYVSSLAPVGQPTKILITALDGNIKKAKCHGEASGSIKIEISGGYPPYKNKKWLPIEQYNVDSAINLPEGIHTVQLMDAKGCPANQTFYVPQPEPFKAWVHKYKDISCYKADNGEIEIKTTDSLRNISYTWNQGITDNKNHVKNLKPGIGNNTYRVTATNSEGCKSIVTQEINEPLELVIDDVKIDSVSCPKYSDGVIVIYAKGGTPDLVYSINAGKDYYSGSKFTKLPGMQYNLTVKDANGCIAARNYLVNEPEELVIAAKMDSSSPDTLTMGDRVQLYFDTSSFSGLTPITQGVYWSPSIGLSCTDCKRPYASPYVSGIYEVEVTYLNNCKAKSKVLVPVYDPLDFFVPSAFSPGSDGLNDKLFVFGNGIKKLSLTIYNRWGEKVFEANHISQGWDGNYKGEPQPSGVYSYSAEIQYLNGEKRDKKGSITLIK